MKHALVLALALTLTTPAVAEEHSGLAEGLEQLGEGANSLLEGLMKELGPALDDLESLGAELAPLLEDLNSSIAESLGDLSAYHAPEILPNGDILIRRKEPLAPEEEAPSGPIDL